MTPTGMASPQLTGDASWGARRMRRYAKRIEACHHRPVWRAMRHLGIDPTGHGWEGWLQTEAPFDFEAWKTPRWTIPSPDPRTGSFAACGIAGGGRWHWLFGLADPNSRPWGSRSFEGLCYTPLATTDHQRTGTRERLRRAQAANPDRLHIELDALATRVLFDAGGSCLRRRISERRAAVSGGCAAERRSRHTPRSARTARGDSVRRRLQYTATAHALGYRAKRAPPFVRNSRASRLAGRRSQSPGPLRGRGDSPHEPPLARCMQGARFERGDPVWQRWKESREGMYASNGAAMAFVRRSRHQARGAGHLLHGPACAIRRLFPGILETIRDHHDYLTWAVLKAYTHNRAGSVTLQVAPTRARRRS